MFRLQPSETLDRFIIGKDLISDKLIYNFHSCVEAMMNVKNLSKEDAEADLLNQVQKINNTPEDVSDFEENEEGIEYFSGVALLSCYDNAPEPRKKEKTENGREVLSGFDESDMRVLLENREFLDSAIMGELVHDGCEFVYNYNSILFCMLEENPEWTPTDAIEWVDYNTIRSGAYVSLYPLILDFTWCAESGMVSSDFEDDFTEY